MDTVRYYSIASFTLSISYIEGMPAPEPFEPFAIDKPSEPTDFTITTHAYDDGTLPVPTEDEMELVSEDIVNQLYIWHSDGGDFLIKRTAMQEGDPRRMWSVMPMNTYGSVDVHIPASWINYVNIGNAFMFEKMLLSRGVIMLHCSLIDWQGKGIAFTAPSQTGKSTQANLWNAHRSAEILNGDRAILRVINNKVFAYGSPWAGSSAFYVNRSVPLAALVALSQASVNSVRAMPHDESLHYILIGTSLPMWDETLLDLGVTAIEKLITLVPSYMLAATPDDKAVVELEKYIA